MFSGLVEWFSSCSGLAASCSCLCSLLGPCGMVCSGVLLGLSRALFWASYGMVVFCSKLVAFCSVLFRWILFCSVVE